MEASGSMRESRNDIIQWLKHAECTLLHHLLTTLETL